jgi:hypothetical protein
LSQAGWSEGDCCYREAREVGSDVVGGLLGVEGGKEGAGERFESGV